MYLFINQSNELLLEAGWGFTSANSSHLTCYLDMFVVCFKFLIATIRQENCLLNV